VTSGAKTDIDDELAAWLQAKVMIKAGHARHRSGGHLQQLRNGVQMRAVEIAVLPLYAMQDGDELALRLRVASAFIDELADRLAQDFPGHVLHVFPVVGRT